MSSTDQPTGDAAQSVSGVSTITDPSVLDTPHDHAHPRRHDHDVGTVHENAPYAYSLINWGSVLAGAVIALAIGGMLSLAGLAIGATALDPTDARSAASVGVGAGLWLALSTVLGMLVGGYVAARSAHNPDHHEGALHGASVWAVGFVLAFFLTGSFATNAVFNGLQAAGQAAEAVTPAAADRVSSTARQAADAATPDTAQEREAVDAAKDATSAGAFWAFITMLTSAVAAMIGGTLGARHDEKMHRPRRTSGASAMF
ncbi:MAG: hypothetical protein KY446_04100 [Proteobacteria bacterium]|nr:hypothetical protein [Pseudomonadota bacterium]MBW3616925.1 hypothetical protein [Pseudomonadota bacterium]